MSNNLGLTYKLEFPRIASDGDATNQDDMKQLEEFCDTKSDIPEDKKTVVVVLGWTGAQDGQLAKFSEIFHNMGCITLRCVIPPQVIYADIGRLSPLAAKVLGVIRENQLESNPIFFHVISNGGACLYSHIIRELAMLENPSEFDVRGTIFDSAPYSPTATSAYRAVKTTCSSYKICGVELGPVIASAVVLAGMVRIFWVFNKLAWECFTTGTFKRLASSNNQVETFPLCNFLTRIWKLRNHSFAFMYSEADTITPWQEVEQLAGMIHHRGNPIELVKFNGSGHMLHYSVHPEEYITAINRFIKTTMESYNGPTLYWEE